MIVQINPVVPKWLRIIGCIIAGILLIALTGIILVIFTDLAFSTGLIVR